MKARRWSRGTSERRAITELRLLDVFNHFGFAEREVRVVIREVAPALQGNECFREVLHLLRKLLRSGLPATFFRFAMIQGAVDVVPR